MLRKIANLNLIERPAALFGWYHANVIKGQIANQEWQFFQMTG
jgi:hypothetical protein